MLFYFFMTDVVIITLQVLLQQPHGVKNDHRVMSLSLRGNVWKLNCPLGHYNNLYVRQGSGDMEGSSRN